MLTDDSVGRKVWYLLEPRLSGGKIRLGSLWPPCPQPKTASATVSVCPELGCRLVDRVARRLVSRDPLARAPRVCQLRKSAASARQTNCRLAFQTQRPATSLKALGNGAFLYYA
ncbi:unnamed protein product [Protopolystoma xenopodis]|uniref:Uncharacterized protein n=1 Tax=Protopolystoma xenopodis TaxID=117903 RepID=A0A3S5B5I3_9PLAT|nr:unnamed protein product [Protopolystoma xenopodis]